MSHVTGDGEGFGRKRTFPELDPRTFQHPLDRAALRALQSVPGLDWVVRKLLTQLGERRLRLYFLGSAVRVDERQFPRFHELYLEACGVLDIAEPPELFVTQIPVVNAAAIGTDKPFIVLTSELYDTLDDRELQCVMAHELGHVMCGHALYTTLLLIILRMWFLFLSIPGGVYALIVLRAALMEWSRKAELSSDRAGLLAVQDPELAYRVDMKLAGGKRIDEMSLEAFLQQGEEFNVGGDILDGILKMSFMLDATHPFAVMRVRELHKWVEAGQYERVLKGDYIRRGQAVDDGFVDDVKKTAESYRAAVSASRDPFLETLRDLGSGVAATGGSLFDFFKRSSRSAAKKTAESAKEDDPRAE